MVDLNKGFWSAQRGYLTVEELRILKKRCSYCSSLYEVNLSPIVCDKCYEKYEIHLPIKRNIYRKQMKFVSIKKDTPKDDENVLVINEKIIMLPIKAYYNEEWKEFLSLESDSNVPLSVTHWMTMPKIKKG